jgi:hypothetical protein
MLMHVYPHVFLQLANADAELPRRRALQEAFGGGDVTLEALFMRLAA